MSHIDVIRHYFDAHDSFVTTQEIAQAVQLPELKVASAMQGLLLQAEVEAKFPDRGRGRFTERQAYRKRVEDVLR
jgi:hypothetical protein